MCAPVKRSGRRCGLLGILTSNQVLEPSRPIPPSRGPGWPGASQQCRCRAESKAIALNYPRSSCAPVLIAGSCFQRERREPRAGHQLWATCLRESHAFPGTLHGPFACSVLCITSLTHARGCVPSLPYPAGHRAPCSVGLAGSPVRAPLPAGGHCHYWAHNAVSVPYLELGDSGGCPQRALGCGRAEGIPVEGPNRPRTCTRVPVLPAIMAARALERSRGARPGSRLRAKAARVARAGDALLLSPPRCVGPGALPVGLRGAVPSGVGARRRRAGPRGGRAQAGSARGGVPAGARTRSCGARRGAGAANPQLLPPAQPERARLGGGRPGGAAPGRTGPQRAQRPRWYSGRVRSPDLPAEQGCPSARARLLPPPPGGLPRTQGARAPRFPRPLLPGPPCPLPRPDPAAKGWAGKRALWDRCQLRDKRHKIGGNGGSAASALGRGPRRRGGRILGAGRGKFGKSVRRLCGGGGRAAQAALRAALVLSAPLLNNSWRARRPLACTGRAARLCQAAAAFGARAASDGWPVPSRCPPVAPGASHRGPARALGRWDPSPPDGQALSVRARCARLAAPGCT